MYLVPKYCLQRIREKQLLSVLAVSGTIFGMANTLSSLGGFLSSLMVGMLTQDNVSSHHN
jgi:uncharacterized membrane protein YjfL (UPF0719 family)